MIQEKKRQKKRRGIIGRYKNFIYQYLKKKNMKGHNQTRMMILETKIYTMLAKIGKSVLKYILDNPIVNDSS